MTTPATIAVLGLGNVLLGDDGVGPYVVEQLRARYELPDNVTVADLGTPGLGLTAHLSQAEAVILVDAVAAKGEAGELRFYGRDDLNRLPLNPRVSPHDPAVQDAFWLMDLTGDAPREVLVVGVIPERLTLGAGLSDRVRCACEPAIEAILGELARLGACAAPRARPGVPDLWWMAA